MSKTLTGSLALTKLIHAPYKSSKGADCIMIPIEANKLEIDDKGGVYLPIRVVLRDEKDQYGNDGFISKSIGTKQYKALKEEEKEMLKDNKSDISKTQTMIMGNVKDWSNNNNSTSGAVSNDVHQASAPGEPDDLPF